MTDGGTSSSGTAREKVEELREKLEDGAGEIAVRFDDAHGHQYWEWRGGEIVRLTHPDFNDDGEYNGPWGTETHLLKKMVGDGDIEIVSRENTPFGNRTQNTDTNRDRGAIDPRAGGLLVIVLGLVLAGVLTVGVMFP